MVGHLCFHELLRRGLLWLCVTWYRLWLRRQAAMGQAHGQRAGRSTRRPPDPKPFPGLLRKPTCGACAQTPEHPEPSPCAPPLIAHTRGCPRQGATRQRLCPNPRCQDEGWVGLGHIRANGHPGGGPWRPLHCRHGRGYVLETHGTPVHGRRVPAELLVRVVAALAEGLGSRAVARVVEVDPHTVRPWSGEAADHLRALAHALRPDGPVSPVQRDELGARLSAVKAGARGEDAALARWSPASPWGWGASAPVRTRLGSLDAGERTRALAPPVVQQVRPGPAPGCLPRCRTAGLQDDATALLTPVGPWVPPPRRRATGPYRSPVGCRYPSDAVHRWSPSRGAAGWGADGTAWWSAPWLVASRGRPHTDGAAIRRSWRGRPARVARRWRRAAGASSRAARARPADASRWSWLRRTPTLACRLPRDANHGRHPCRPTGQAQRDAGGPGRRLWPPG
jgi:hypothetical protein